MKKITELSEDHLDFIERLNYSDVTPELNTLNQFFLIDIKLFDDIVSCADLKNTDIVLEIGPGTGDLTRELSLHVRRLIAIELDEKMKKFLIKLPKNIDLRFMDAKIYLEREKNTFNKLVSSPPYNLCEPLLHLLTKKPNVELIVLITPLGFFEKATANPIFSSYFKFEKIKDIKKESFYPVPRIGSEIIRIRPRPSFEIDNDKKAFLIRSLYAQKHKVIKNALRSTLINYNTLLHKTLTKNQAREIISSLNLDNDLLEKKMQNLKPEYYDIITDKILKKI